MIVEKDSNVLIIGQHLTSRTEAVRDYLVSKVRHVLVVALGSGYVNRGENHLFHYEAGFLKKHQRFCLSLVKRFGGGPVAILLTYLWYVVSIGRAVCGFGGKFRVCIGISHFSALAGAVLKKLGACDQCVYYCIDYYSPSLGKSLFDGIFIRMANWADGLAVSWCDEVWDISTRIEEGRSKFGRVCCTDRGAYKAKHELVPLGYGPTFYRNRNMEDIDRHAIVFVGVIVKDQGLELLLSALPFVIEAIPDIRVKVIGTGPYLEEFKRIVAREGMNGNFTFYGFIKNEQKMLDIVSSSSLGISLWNNRDGRELNAYYGDPGKTKLYSVCGVPVVVGDVTAYSEIVKQWGGGEAVGYDKEELAAAITKVLINDDAYLGYRNNARKLGQEYCNAEKWFGRVLQLC